MQKQAKSEQVFVAITTPLTWARTQLLSKSAVSALQPVQPSVAVGSSAFTDPPAETLDTAEQADTAPIALQTTQPEAVQPPHKLTAADSVRRRAATCGRSVLEAERAILAAASRTLRTYVICPGVLYGQASRPT